MKLLFATTNPAKIKRYADVLINDGIEVLTLKDLNINIKVAETGKDALENAELKAKAYFEVSKIPTIAIDDTLYIEGIPEDKEPGTHVRRVGNKELTDDEMLEYYTSLVKEYGGKLIANWVYGLVIYNGKEAKKYSWSNDDFYLVATPCKKRNIGYPLDSISIDKRFNKYFAELTDSEKKSKNNNNNDANAIKFIIENI